MNGSSGKLSHGGHAAAQDIISAPIGASKAVDKVIPELNEKFTGMDVHVLTWNESFMDLTCHLKKAVKFNDIRLVVKQESECPLGYTEDQLSSVTFHSNTYSSTCGAGTGVALKDNFEKFISWQ